MNVKVGATRWCRDPKICISNAVLGTVTGAEMTLFALLSWLDRKGRGVKTSVTRLSGGTGLSAPTVHTALRSMEKKRLIRYTPGKAPSDPWIYRVLLRPGDDRYFLVPLSYVREYSGNELLVFGQLSCCSNAYGVAYPSHRRIASALHLAVNTVRSCLSKLKDKAALEMIPRWYKQTRARRSFAYSLLQGRGVSNICMPVRKPTRERKDFHDKKEGERNTLTLNRLNLLARTCKKAGVVLQKLGNLFFGGRDTVRQRGRDPCGKRRDHIFSFLSLRREDTYGS